jgi:D-alanyl-D-alanine carboxypeptidase
VGDDRARPSGLAALAVLLLAGACGGSHAPRFDAGVRRVVAAGVPGALVLVRDGGRTRTAAAGLAEVAPRRELRPDDRFRIGSVTKTFVATIVLELAAEKRLRLEDPVARWLPGLLPDGRRITVRDLLAHRSGLADVADDPEVLNGSRAVWSPRRLVALVGRRPRIGAPGGAFHYSSTNYLVLGLVVERVTGRSVGAELRRRIVGPLGLTDTSYQPGPLAGRHVHGYRLASHQGVVDFTSRRDLEPRSAHWAGASGDLVSSARDLARFLAVLLGGEVLPPRELHAMEAVSPRYGLGVAVYPTRCGLAWGHTGNLNGVLTIAWSTRDGRRQAIVIANAYPLPAAADVALRRAAVTAFCGTGRS